MLRFIRKLPALFVLVIGVIVVTWGAYAAFHLPQPPPATEYGVIHLEPPTVGKLLGIEPDDGRVQGLVGIVVGSAAIALSVFVLRQESEQA